MDKSSHDPSRKTLSNKAASGGVRARRLSSALESLSSPAEFRRCRDIISRCKLDVVATLSIPEATRRVQTLHVPREGQCKQAEPFVGDFVCFVVDLQRDQDITTNRRRRRRRSTTHLAPTKRKETGTRLRTFFSSGYFFGGEEEERGDSRWTFVLSADVVLQPRRRTGSGVKEGLFRGSSEADFRLL